MSSDQKGLLLWHMMGTGKTLSAIAFILNYPGVRVNVLCPKELTFVWKPELARVPDIENDIRFYSYENVDEFFARTSFQDEILIIDECQHLSIRLQSAQNVGAKISRMRSAEKVLCLSGTPIYTSVTDLVYIVNICAGRDIVPYNDTEFKKKYRDTRVVKSLMMSHVPNLALVLNKLALGAGAAVGVNIYFQIKSLMEALIQANAELRDVIDKGITKKTSVADAKAARFANGFEAIQHFIEDTPKSFRDPGVARRGEDVGEYTLRMAAKKLGDFYDKNESIVTNAAGRAIPMVERAKTIGYIIAALTSVRVILYIIGWFVNKRLQDYKALNVHRLVADISPYVSYYKNVYFRNSPFPHVLRSTETATYDMYQMERWFELTQECFPSKSVADFDIKTEADAAYYAKNMDMDIYLTAGVAIGNLKNKYSGRHCDKFRRILAMAKGKRAVFYSNFTTNGILLLREFFSEQGVDFAYLDAGISSDAKNLMLQQFFDAHKTGKQAFLLLHPSYSEGVSVLGAEQMHLLEPIVLYAKREQVVARVVRYLSHDHLPRDKRVVSIIQWECTSNGVSLVLKKALASLKTWYKLNTEMSFLDKYITIDRDITPDAVVMRDNLISTGIDRDISRIFSARSNKKIDCCIKYPSADQDAECMRKTQRRCRS